MPIYTGGAKAVISAAIMNQIKPANESSRSNLGPQTDHSEERNKNLLIFDYLCHYILHTRKIDDCKG